MQQHTKNYLSYFGFPDFVACENCGAPSVDIHHVIPRSKFGKKEKDKQDHISNLIALCRSCHEKAHANILTKEYLTNLILKR